MTSVTWPQALAWRMRQQLLDPVGGLPVEEVVRRLQAVPAYPAPSAELALRLRQRRSRPGEVARALAEGRLVQVYAFRGATHLLTPQDGGTVLALRAAGRMWERPSWQESYGLAPEDWPDFRSAVREALADGPLTRAELAAAITRTPRFAHLGPAVTGGSDTLLKPLTWQGVMSFGPVRDGEATFQRLDANPRWAGVPDLDVAGPRAVEAYLRAYGPAAEDRVLYWLGEGLGAGRRRIRTWLAGLAPRLAEVDIDGTAALVPTDELEGLMATPAATTVRLLPGHDQWVLGPGTADPHVVPPARRKPVTRGANLVTAGGVVSGTWAVTGEEVDVSWFPEAGPTPREELDEQVGRLSEVLGRSLRLALRDG